MATILSKLPGESQTRVEDYLNDKFQNGSDLENVDQLLAKIHEQQKLLRDQLDEAKKEHQTASQVFENEVDLLKKRARKHEADQADISRRINALTQSEVSDDAVAKFDEPMQKLRRIEIAEDYARTLQSSQQLEHQVRQELESNPHQALAAFRSLQTILQGVQDAQPAAEGAAPHLLDHLSAINGSLYNHIKHHLEDKLHATLDQMKWPKKDLTLLRPVIEGWTQHTELLLELQEPDLLRKSSHLPPQQSQTPVVLLPLAVMVHPLAQRFRFHFYGDKPTNRLDKPEYFFSHFLDLLDQYATIISDLLQPVLDDRVRRDDRLDLIYTDAVSAFITALLSMVSAKCLSVLPHLTSQPQLMSHFVREMMSFDTSLQQSWAYSPLPGPLSEWKGLTWDMLTQHGYFDSWLKLERDFALARYKKIQEAPDSREIDYDGVEEGRTKPTKGAVKVNDLLETITDRYRLLSSFSQKLTFLMDVQLSIFDRYHGWLHGAFQAYQTESHTAGRMISGRSADDAMGETGLATLLKIFGSAEYLERKMTDWSDDVFFLEIWEELQDRASQSQNANGTVGRNLNVEEVAAKTSSTIRNADEILESDGGALFDETATSYRRLRELSEAEIVRAVQVNARNAIRPFQTVSIWASFSTTLSEVSQMAPSSALDTFDQTMKPLLALLTKVLAPAPLQRIIKQLCLTLQEEVVDRLILKNTFSAAGANQLKRDVIAITSTIDTTIRRSGEAQRHFTRLNDALSLLSLPIKSSRPVNGNEDIEETSDWEFDDDEETLEDEIEEDSTEVNSWGLWQAERAIFADNASARRALESMHLTGLSETDARNIIKRRIEVNS